METSTVIGCDWSILPPLLATNIYKNKNNENTVKPGLTDTNLIRTRHHFRQLLNYPWGKHIQSLNSTRLIGTPINTDNGHLFLAQSTNSHRKSTLLMWTLHYQLYVVINLSFLKVKSPSVDSMSMFCALPRVHQIG